MGYEGNGQSSSSGNFDVNASAPEFRQQFIRYLAGVPDDLEGSPQRRYPWDEKGPLRPGESMPPVRAGYEPPRPTYRYEDRTAPVEDQANRSFKNAQTASSDYLSRLNKSVLDNPTSAGGISSRMSDLQPPTAPTMDPGYEAAQKRIRDYTGPTDKFIPGTNKVKPEYRIGIGGRIMGSVANFLSGFGGRGPVTYVGPGATNRAYDVAEDRRQAALGKAQADAKSFADTFNTQEKSYQNELQAYQDELKRLSQAPVAEPETTSVATSPVEPQPAQKTVSKGQVMALARKHKVPYPHAKKQFEDKNYVVK